MARKTTEQAQAEVRAAAQAVLDERGVGAFTVDAVVERSGVAKTTIYRHWPSAHHLMIEAVSSRVHALPTPNTGDLRTDLRQLFTTLLGMVDRSPLRTTVLDLLAASSRDAELAEVRNEMVDGQMTPLHTVLELAQLRGELAPDLDLDLAADVLQGALFYRRMVRGAPVDPDQLDQLIQLALDGLSP